MKKIILTAFLIFIVFVSSAYAQGDVATDTQEQREAVTIERSREVLKRPETVKDIIELLKERALLKVKEKRKALLLKTRVSAGAAYGFETNVTQSADTKGDYYSEENFSFSWLPTFNSFLGFNTGYWLVNQMYSEQTDSSSLNHAVNFSLVLSPLERGTLKLEPGIEYEWLWYPKSKESTYDNLKYFLKLKHYIGKRWNYGAGYEYSEKFYDEKRARNQEKRESPDIVREDTRHTADVYITRYLGKYTLKVKGKFFVNYSNDQYRQYYDYYSLKPLITIARTFLKDDRLYMSFTPSFERKNYHHRTAVDTARYDDVTTWATAVYYTFKKPFTLSYKFTYKEVETNVDTGRYKNITNVFGINADF